MINVSDIINVIAIILAPIVSVIIGQKLQERAKKRQDKMEIFRVLMTSRVYGWTPQSVHALNILDIVFADNKEVTDQWKVYYDKLCIENPKKTDLEEIEKEKYKLLEVIANSLGYKGKITWETIQKPYIPKGLLDSMTQQQKFQNDQSEIMEMMKSGPLTRTEKSKNGENQNGQNENGVS